MAFSENAFYYALINQNNKTTDFLGKVQHSTGKPVLYWVYFVGYNVWGKSYSAYSLKLIF